VSLSEINRALQLVDRIRHVGYDRVTDRLKDFPKARAHFRPDESQVACLCAGAYFAFVVGRSFKVNSLHLPPDDGTRISRRIGDWIRKL